MVYTEESLAYLEGHLRFYAAATQEEGYKTCLHNLLSSLCFRATKEGTVWRFYKPVEAATVEHAYIALRYCDLPVTEIHVPDQD